jgi:hypothetical protein
MERLYDVSALALANRQILEPSFHFSNPRQTDLHLKCFKLGQFGKTILKIRFTYSQHLIQVRSGPIANQH